MWLLRRLARRLQTHRRVWGWILTLLLLGTAPVYAGDRWTDDDLRREAAYVGIAGIDWAQSRWLVRHRICERNPILGERPTVHEVDRYFLVTTALHAVVTDALPARYRPIWQYVTIGVEVGAVTWNLSAGVHLDF